MSLNISEQNIFIFLHFPENNFLFKCSKGGSSFTEISLSAGNRRRGNGLMGWDEDGFQFVGSSGKVENLLISKRRVV